MNTARRVLAANVIASQSSLLREKRAAELDYISNPIKRGLMRSVLRATFVAPHVAAHLAGVRLNPSLQFVGEGMQAKVYKNGDEVVKLLDGTARLTRHERRACAAHMRDDHAKLQAYLGNMVVPHEISVGPNPFLPDQEIIRIHQPYVSMRDSELFTMGEPSINHARLSSLRETHPGIGNHLARLVTGSMAMFSETALLPDTNGTGNIAVSNAGLVFCIDGQPISGLNKEGQELILAQVESLQSAL